ncbi:MAG: carboxymuconolactone decarboxylase [Armatimonadetes bacterium OLB18]|nr:MAG: carboxymuconolactone decarboxylase [Armatimonadetes bacterium OLB18]
MGKVPGHYSRFLEKHPEVASAYRKLSQAVAEDGPLDPKTCALIKLGMSVAANREALRTATRARRSKQARLPTKSATPCCRAPPRWAFRR